LVDGLVPRNVAGAVRLPKLTKKEIKPLSPEHAGAFLEPARGDRFEALYAVAVTAGLREREPLGLKWEDVDLNPGLFRFGARCARPAAEASSSPPRTARPERELTARALGALRAHMATQGEERLRLGTLWDDHDLIFPSRRGTPMNAKNLTARSFKPILKSAGLPNIRLHDLRHTCATLLLPTISITLDTYSHVLPA
jgi:integrase